MKHAQSTHVIVIIVIGYRHHVLMMWVDTHPMASDRVPLEMVLTAYMCVVYVCMCVCVCVCVCVGLNAPIYYP